MKGRELRLLLTLAEELHFGRAAERLGIAQPQLSEIVRRIEAEVGVTIFARRPQVRVTFAGEVIIAAARRVLADLDTATKEARAVSAGRVGTVRLGFSAVSMCTTLPSDLHRFLAEYPQVELKFVEGPTGPLREQLERGTLDIILSRDPIVTEGFESVRYAVDRTNVVVPAAHWAAEKEVIRLSELEDESFVLFPRSSAPRYHDRLMRWCREWGLKPNIVRQPESWIGTCGLVGAGMGITFGTQMLSRIAFPGVTYVSLGDQALEVDFWLSWVPSRLSPAAINLLQIISNEPRD